MLLIVPNPVGFLDTIKRTLSAEMPDYPVAAFDFEIFVDSADS